MVNTRKTKIMVFARSKTRLRNLPTFKFGNLDLDLVDENDDYVYFDICFNWNGSFVKAKQLLHDNASKAMYSLIQKGRQLKLPTDIMPKHCLTVVWHPFYCMDVKCGVMKIPISLKKYIQSSVNSCLVYQNYTYYSLIIFMPGQNTVLHLCRL